MLLRGVTDLEPRQQAELDRLLGDRIGAGDHRLAGDHGGDGRQPHHRQQCPVGIEQKERVLDRLGIGEHQRALAEIVDGERGQHQDDPGGLDRLLSEMTEIGVERLGAGHRQEHGTERDQADHAMGREELHRIGRIEGEQHLGMAHDIDQAGDGDGDEPQRCDRTEEGCDPGGAARLHRKQRDQDHDRQRHNERLEGRGRNLEPFDGGQHRQRRRDHGVAVEQRCADDPAQHHRSGTPAQGALCQRHQGERAAFALVVGAQQDEHVFEGDDDDQRPQDQREHPEHRLAGRGTAGAGGGDRFPQRVERACSDVAVDDADAADGERPEGGLATRFAVPVDGQHAPLVRGSNGLGHLPLPCNAAVQYGVAPISPHGRCPPADHRQFAWQACNGRNQRPGDAGLYRTFSNT